MNKKKKKKEELWALITRIGIIIAIVAGIATIYGVFAPVEIANIDEIKALVDESNRTLMLIQEKEEKASSEMEAMDSTVLSPEAIQVHQDIETLTNSYEFINKNINRIGEISSKKYLKSLSKYELLMLSMDDMSATKKINDMIISDIQQIIKPYVDNKDFDREILSKHYNEVYCQTLIILSEAYSWNKETESINSELAKYNASGNKRIKKPGYRLFRICRASIASKKKVALLNDWSKFLQQFIGYLSELEAYYIQNQSDKSQTNE